MALVLGEAEIAKLLEWDDLIPLMRRTLGEFSDGGVLQPVRAVLPISEHGSICLVMPGHIASSGALAIKVVTVAERNAGRGLPSHLATVLLLDPATGQLLALLDGRLITEMRTAAVSAAAADALALPATPALALIGSGVQARSHLAALRRVRAIARVRVWSPSRERRETFAREHTGPSLEVTAAPDAETAVRGAQLVVTATSSAEPVVRGAWLAEGACVLAVGASRPSARELDAAALAGARVFVDSRAAAAAEAGDILLAIGDGAISAGHVLGEIGEVFAGRLAGRTDPREITLFKSLGLAAEDAAAALLAYQRAKCDGIGRTIEI